MKGRTAKQPNAGRGEDSSSPSEARHKARRALRKTLTRLSRPASLLLVPLLLIGTLVPLALLTDQPVPQQGTIIGGVDNSTFPVSNNSPTGPTAPDQDGEGDPSDPSGGTDTGDDGDTEEEVDPATDFELGVLSDTIALETSGGSYIITTDEYSITATNDNGYVDYVIKPYFSDDVIRYRRVNPQTASEGTVDQNGNDMNWVSMSITDHGQDGNTIWFLEWCPQFSIKQSFTIYRDYFELDATYTPGTSNVIATYFVGLYSSSGSMYNMFADGQPHRYIPGVPESTPASNGIGGWFPAYQMFAPAFDMRVPGGTMGVEWGFDETEAYLYSPIWMKDYGGGGASVFALKFTSTGSVVPDPGLGTEQTWSMFVRPYKYVDGEPRGHDAGYAQWVSESIAEQYGNSHSGQFPLMFNDFGTWTSELRNWIEGSEILVATQSTNPDQVNWHYKSAQRMSTSSETMPTAWRLYDSAGHAYSLSDGTAVASAASSAYRNYLINQDAYNDWWWSSRGVFWDEMNSWYGENNRLRSDYSDKGDFIYDGYIDLVLESLASGHWDFVITNSFTPQIQLAMVSDAAVIEGWEAVDTYNMSLRDTAISTMLFVNNIPEEYRPHIVVYQNYDADRDQGAVYSVLFGAARYGFSVDLLSYSSYSKQMHNLIMAHDMFVAMGASMNRDPTIPVATLDMGSEGTTVTTDRQMVVLTGSGSPTISFTEEFGEYKLTNLHGSAISFELVLPGPGYYEAGPGITQTGDLIYRADGTVVFRGTIGAEATGTIVKRGDLAAYQYDGGEASAELVSRSADSVLMRATSTGGETRIWVGGLDADRDYDVIVDGEVVATLRSDDLGWVTFQRSYGTSWAEVQVRAATS